MASDVIQTEEVTEVEVIEPIVEEVVDREVGGIKIPGNSKVPDDDVLRYKDSIKDYTIIELLHEIKKYEKDLITAENYREFFETSKVTIDNLRETTKNLGTLANDMANVDTESLQEESGDPEELNFEEVLAELEDFRDRTNVGIIILKDKFEEVKATGGMSLKDDVIKTLVKNISTVESTTDLNKDIFKSCMESVIAEFNAAPNGILDPYPRLSSKLSNPKRVKDMVYRVVKDTEKARKEFISVGFTDEMYDSFINFLKVEDAYFVYTHDGIVDPNEPPCIVILDNGDMFRYISSTFTCYYARVSSKMYVAVELFSLIFFYQISRIVRTESKKRNYLSLIYKCYILQALELATLHHEAFRSTPESMENRKNLEEGTEDYEISRMRQKLYESYLHIFWTYGDYSTMY